MINQIEKGSEELSGTGLKPFVASRLPLFVLREGRSAHLRPGENGLVVDGGGPQFDREELLDLLDKEPASFSCGALLRPLIQDYLLPSLTTVGGPAEVGYFAQLGPLSKWLGVERPRILLRFQGTLLAGEGRQAWKELGLDGGSLAAALNPEDLVSPADERGELAELRAIGERLSALGSDLETESPGSRGVERGLRTAQASLARLASRIRKLQARGDPAAWERASTAWNHLLPDDKLQERRWGFLQPIAEYGTEWIETVLEEIGRDPFSLSHRLIEFDS